MVHSASFFLFSAATPSKLFDWNGVKVGLVGVVESEWMDTTICFDSSVKYVDQVEVATKIARELREEGAQIVIAVTHSRGPNDILLAQHVDGIDLILGGHDHDYYLFHANGIPILNSGSDFKQMTLVEVTLKSETKDFSTDAEEIDTSCKDKTSWDLDGRRAKFTLHRYDVTSDIEPDPDMLKIIEEVSAEMEVMKSHVLGHSDSVWDARTASVRTKESAIGNFVADLMRVDYGSDMALLQGGCIRSNAQYGEGAITFGDIMKMFPFVDSTVMFEIQGKYIWEALESGFSQWPKQEGRFPQLSGCKVVVDVSKEPGSRLVSVEIGDQPLDEERLYTVSSKPYTMKGGDGYTALTNKTR